MRKFKKWSSIILAALLCGTVLLTGCDSNEDPEKESSDGTRQTTEEPTNGTTGNNEIPTEQPTEQPTEPADPCAKGHTEVIDAAVDPTCTEKGKTQGKHCSVCGEVLVVQNDVDALGHTEVIDAAVGPTCTEKGKTEGKHCQTCGAILIAQTTLPVTGHGFGEWSIIKEPTETTKGEIRRDCAECGHFEITVVAELSHDHSRYESILLESVTPTCTATGLTVGIKCSGCGELLISQQIIPAKGHDYKSTVTSPTCTAKGYTTYTCHCGDTYTADETKALGHTEVIDDAVAATCTQTGKTEGAHCSVCKEVLIAQSTIPTKEHDYKSTVALPTCTAKGYTTYTCHCGDTYTADETKALGHTEVIDDAVAATCTQTGKTEGAHCSVCKTILLAQQTIPATGHTYRAKVTSPTATEDGRTSYSCLCGDTYTEPIIPTKFKVTSSNREKIGYKGKLGEKLVIPAVFNDNGTWYRVTGIDVAAFYNCDGLESVTLPESVTNISVSAFYNCTRMISITIPNSVTQIGDSAFSGCGNLMSITIPENVTKICDSTFRDCRSLTTIVIPNRVKSFGKSAFEGCCDLTSITIPETMTTIEDSTFSGCADLTSVIIPDSVTSIGDKAFYSCQNLKSITIPNGVRSIGTLAFWNCRSLKSVTVGDRVTSIGEEAFDSCRELSDVYITDLTAWCKIRFGDSSASPLTYAKNFYLNGELVTEIVIPDGITSIGNWAFFGCDKLTSVVMPNDVTSIGDSAFGCCDNLTSVTLSENLKTIGNSAFNWCNLLTDITIPNRVTRIGDYAFSNCVGLTKMELPNSLTHIGDYAFEACGSLTSIVIPDSVTDLGNHVLEECNGLENVIIGNGVRSIGDYAFFGCENLTSITFGNRVTSIGDYAFGFCYGFIDVVIPDSVTNIGGYAFLGCTNLSSIVISDSVTEIGEGVFDVCIGFKALYYGGSEEDWKKISVGPFNSNLTKATHYYYSETKPTTSGNYWRYVDGMPTAWE